MSKLKSFKFIDPIDNETVYYLAEKEYDNLDDARRQIWHREDGPANIHYRKDGSIRYECYCINDNLHREDGPARIWYNKDGNIYGEVYWLDGEEYTKEEYNKEMKKRNTKIGRELYE